MANWFWKLFFPKQEEPKVEAPFKIRRQFIVAGHVFYPKQSDEPGKTPTLIAMNELMYNSSDDVFFVGIGNDKWKTYK